MATLATTLVVAGFLQLVGSVCGINLSDFPNRYVWIYLPYHDYRFRLMIDARGRVQIRTYFGSWRQVTVQDYINPLMLMLTGYAFLIASLPEMYRNDRHGKRVVAGHCGQCNYDLTANTTGICPECGTPVEKSHL